MTEITTEQAQEFLLAQNKQRAEQCKQEIQKILDQYKCQIRAYPLIVDGKIVAQAKPCGTLKIEGNKVTTEDPKDE